MHRPALLLVTLGVLLSTQASAEIGRVKSAVGPASVQRGETHIPASIGQELMPGDWLETGKDGRMSLTFADDTRFAVGPDSRIALTKFDYDPTSQNGSFIAEVERGSVAVVSGRITKTRCGGQTGSSGPNCGMEVRTPNSTLGIHGTRFIVTVPR